MLTKKEFSFVIPNKPGTLADITAALAKGKINIVAVDATGGFEYNIVRLVPDKPGKAKKILERKGLDVGEASVLCLPVQEQIGTLATIAAKLSRAKINIDYLYGSNGPGGHESLLVIRPSDVKKAERALRG